MEPRSGRDIHKEKFHKKTEAMKSRRDFIKTSAVMGIFGLLHQWASALPLSDKFGSILPQRRLIRNGEKVTAFCLGAGTWGIPVAWQSQKR